MKKLFFVIAALLPAISFAGPEDHIPGAIFKATTPAPLELMQFVFDSAKASQDEQTITLEARYGNLTGEFKVIERHLRREDRVVYTAEKILFAQSSNGCGEAKMAKATIQGVDYAGFGLYLEEMTLKVDYYFTDNVCNTAPQHQVFEYVFTK